MGSHLFDERCQQILESELAAVDVRLGERSARRERLERLQEAAIDRVIDEAFDRPRPGLKAQVVRSTGVFIPEAHCRAEGGMGIAGQCERQRARHAGLGRSSDHGIGGPEVQTKRDGSGGRRRRGRAGHKSNTPPFVDAWRDELAMCGLAGGLRILRHRLSSPTDAKRCIDISIGPTLAA